MNIIFKPYTYKQSMDILSNFTPIQDNTKTLVVFAGCNGSGKSTLIANLIKQNLLSYPYINADLIKNKNPTLNDFEAMEIAVNEVNECINKGKSFIYETVLSHISKVELLKEAKEKGFTIKFIYVATNNPDINIERVQKRVQQGGHDVPKDKIISRFYRSKENASKVLEFANQSYIFENSNNINFIQWSNNRE